MLVSCVAFYATNNGDNNGGDIYCGYSLGNTVYRFVLCGLTIIYAFAMVIPGLVEQIPKTHYWLIFYFSMFWFGATTADCTAIYMSYGTCNNFFGGSNARFFNIANDYDCSGARYGESLFYPMNTPYVANNIVRVL